MRDGKKVMTTPGSKVKVKVTALAEVGRQSLYGTNFSLRLQWYQSKV